MENAVAKLDGKRGEKGVVEGPSFPLNVPDFQERLEAAM
jgi:hypothetical protein